MRLVLYTIDATDTANLDDLVTVGQVEFDSASERWLAHYDWHELRHVSDLDEQECVEYLRLRSLNP